MQYRGSGYIVMRSWRVLVGVYMHEIAISAMVAVLTRTVVVAVGTVLNMATVVAVVLDIETTGRHRHNESDDNTEAILNYSFEHLLFS